MNTNDEPDLSNLDLDNVMDDQGPEDRCEEDHPEDMEIHPEDNERDDTPFLTEDNLWEDMHETADS